MPSFTYTPIVAKAHTPPYKIHKYFARRPHNVFNQLIENFTSPGEIILDPFCGGGVTIYEGVTQDRRVIGCDLNPLSTFIATIIAMDSLVFLYSSVKCTRRIFSEEYT